ncbi:hypothetical protein AB0331_15545 [Dietzia maris]|uniref:hypothetical protein n=1 Tax=Dietzia maris TaxID=37915 RepID=UPI00344C4427
MLELVAVVVLVGVDVEVMAEELVVDSTSTAGSADCPHPVSSRIAAAPAQAAADLVQDREYGFVGIDFRSTAKCGNRRPRRHQMTVYGVHQREVTAFLPFLPQVGEARLRSEPARHPCHSRQEPWREDEELALPVECIAGHRSNEHRQQKQGNPHDH